MPKTNHVHRIKPLAWSVRPSELHEDVPVMPPAVLLGCTMGVCAKTESVIPSKRDRKVPVGMTAEQFQALKDGAYWPEIVGA